MRSRQGGQCCTARYHRDNITSRWSISGTGAARCAKAGSSAHVAHAQCCCAAPPILLQPWVQQHTWEACNPGLTSLQAHHPAAMRSLPACAPVTPIEHPYMHACMQCLSLPLAPPLCADRQLAHCWIQEARRFWQAPNSPSRGRDADGGQAHAWLIHWRQLSCCSPYCPGALDPPDRARGTQTQRSRCGTTHPGLRRADL